MFCDGCGVPVGKDVQFCPNCGKEQEQFTVQEGDTKDAKQDTLMPMADDQVKEDSARPQVKQSRGKVIAVVTALVIVVAAIVVAFVILRMPPSLSDDQILEDFNVDAAIDAILTESNWGSNDGYQVTSRTVEAVDDSSTDNQQLRTVIVDTVAENDSFKIDSTWNVLFVLQDRTWVPNEPYEVTRTITPKNGVSDDKVVEQVPSFIQVIDEDPPKDADGNKQYLEKIYNKGVKFEVLENNTSGGSDGTVKISLEATRGFATYRGTLSLDFVWNGSDWEYKNCAVDKEAYVADYTSLVGTWTGTFIETEHNDVMDQAACYGGKNQPIILTVKSVDGNALTARVDMSFVVHTHGSLTNPAESTEGDKLVTVSDALITLRPRTTSFYKIYGGSDPSGHSVELCCTEDGAMNMEVLTGASFDKEHFAAWRNDYFTMTKAS